MSKAFDPHLLVTDMQPTEALVEKAQASTRFSLLLIGSFAVIAALLAGVGLYGVLATVVRQRTAEIGIRMAVGAQSRNIFQLVVGQGLSLAGIGMAAGLIAAFFLTRGMTTILVGVMASDPATYIVMAVEFFLIAAVASWLPASRVQSQSHCGTSRRVTVRRRPSPGSLSCNLPIAICPPRGIGQFFRSKTLHPLDQPPRPPGVPTTTEWA
jgi:predicted lysophospholipase L1 biosynthesis ABC-type transport system permease subunit